MNANFHGRSISTICRKILVIISSVMIGPPIKFCLPQMRIVSLINLLSKSMVFSLTWYRSPRDGLRLVLLLLIWTALIYLPVILWDCSGIELGRRHLSKVFNRLIGDYQVKNTLRNSTSVHRKTRNCRVTILCPLI
jgi:hypothetical protein